MTLHTRVMVTSPGVDPAAVFVKMRQIIGAGEQYSAWTSPELDSDNAYRRTMSPGFHMDLGQGLPALMWVDFAKPGETVGGHEHDKWCYEWDDAGEPTEVMECSGGDPVGYIEINYDTAYGYHADNNASCGDLHAYITQEITAWLDERGATWQWYDESGDGWQPSSVRWGTLGDPIVGAPGSGVDRLTSDPKREFGNLVTALLDSEATR
jgi:hypothetical protein